MNEYILYILMRNDLPSMNSGKAMAQASHASNAFIHAATKTFTNKDKLKGPLQSEVEKWQSETPQGFGTVIVLSANKQQILDVLISSNGMSGAVYDPTYPYIVNAEVAALINEKHHTVNPIHKSDGNVVLHRKELTCAYVFGNKEDLNKSIGHLPLHP
jgi:peptidyl-tRNA hydrolase